MNLNALQKIRKAKNNKEITLNLDNLNLASIPEELCELTQLTVLALNGNQISDITPLKNLVNLNELYLRVNKISDITLLKDLKELVILDISGNQIRDISPLENLLNLRILYSYDNKIKDITPLQNLKALQTISLMGNEVSDLTPLTDLFEYKKNEINFRISLQQNPLETPPIEIASQGTKSILRYFSEKKKGSIKINEAKLLIVGQGGSGKTSLRIKLKNVNADLPAPGDTTRGIEFEEVSFPANNETFTLNMWDFGGQNIQHYAHQFFLTDSSLYVLLTNEREQNPNFQYWLNIIEMLGKGSPVLIVQNEIAGHCEEIGNIAAIRSRYENVITPVHKVDLFQAAVDNRFDKLKKEIQFHASTNLKHVGKEYPNSYLEVRKRLREVKEEKSFITYSDYKNICIQSGIDNDALMTDIVNTFNQLGVCIYFPEDIELQNFIFLDPKWIIDALFSLLYNEKIIAQKGQFSEADTLTIWTDPAYQTMHGKLLRMMERFELAYRIKDSNRYILPQRLASAKDSYNWQETDVTKMEYSYKFMPKGIITRITCRLHEKIAYDSVWNDAVIFQGKKSKVFIREVYSENKIAIEAAGFERSELLNRVIDEMDDIHKNTKISNLLVEKLVPCCCIQCAGSKEPYFFKYDILCQLLENGETEDRCQKSLKKVDITQTLNTSGIQIKATGDERTEVSKNGTTRGLKVFISYAHKDEKLKLKLDAHLSALKNSSKISNAWSDRMIRGGEGWDEKIKKEMEEADIVLLLISSDFMASRYIWQVEVKKAMERHGQNKARVIPIYLRECDVEDMPFDKLQGYPRDKKPITTFSNRDRAYKNVCIEIRKDIEEWKKS